MGRYKTYGKEELVKMLSRWEKLAPVAKEFSRIDKELKEFGKSMSGNSYQIGSYVITRSVTTGYRQPTAGGEFERTTIVITRK